ncbi:MAG TPA: orotate phosphoribosyltransferase [Candidatus Gallacutalibacter stercoravium]|nr:orotate phosphoribosyltransferase [Candidatus Gallacutalibacter stercoravium]
MDSRAIEIQSKRNKKMAIKVVPGHFVTSHSHVNYYVDMTAVKSQHKMARRAARELAKAYSDTLVDTIVCLDGTRIVGAFLADELSQPDNVNMDADIAVITPEINPNNQMIFRDNTQRMIWSKRVILLVASVTTGKTIKRALECIHYYGGEVVAVAALFSAVDQVEDLTINTVFSGSELPDYKTYSYHDCPMCKEKKKIDAMINSYGYSKI